VREMFDSVTAEAIPASATMVAGYANGRWANFTAMKARFPRAVVLGISVNAAHGQLAHVLDIENGDATILDFRAWAVAMAHAGVRRPTAYIARSRLSELLAQQPAGIVTDVWVADWSGAPHPVAVSRANVVAVQYASPAQHSGGDYDLSVVYDYTWHPSS
jgi:hypothetical protein